MKQGAYYGPTGPADRVYDCHDNILNYPKPVLVYSLGAGVKIYLGTSVDCPPLRQLTETTAQLTTVSPCGGWKE